MVDLPRGIGLVRVQVAGDHAIEFVSVRLSSEERIIARAIAWERARRGVLLVVVLRESEIYRCSQSAAQR